MEYKVAFLFLLVELVAGVAVFLYWLRRQSSYAEARSQFFSALRAHHAEGNLAQYLQDVNEGKVVFCEKAKSFAIYIRIAVSMIGGVGLTFLVKLLGAGLLLRFLVGTLAIFPFIYFVSLAIAEEYDENRIAGFVQNSARELLTATPEIPIEDLLHQIST